MAEETIDTGSKSDRALMQDVGFSGELKKQLEERIAQMAFNAQNQRALSEANMPSFAGKGSRDLAAATPWTGAESTADSALRMLDDSHKKLRTPFAAPRIASKVNLRPAPKKNISAADRLANARDKTSIYALSQQSDMTEKEREQIRKELKERFSPGARPMPTTLQGLSSLANERIEDAIARGQFKNIRRGKGVHTEKDYKANSPFLDTTEYFMNKIIQKQEIVPPWIEKQQELGKTVSNFRSRLRNNWRRHAARMIASQGGSVDEQMQRANAYALAEEKVNPRAPKMDRVSSISSDGSLISVPAGVMEESPQQPPQQPPQQEQPEVEMKVTEAAVQDPTKVSGTQQGPRQPSMPTGPPSGNGIIPMAYPFRDEAWETAESAYLNLAVNELNSLTRSYNLMAPKIAQKPYYTLERELNRCYADVAPTLADEILERSRKPRVKVPVVGHKEGGIMERFGAEKYHGHVGTIRDEAGAKGYGLKEFLRDMFRKDDTPKRRQTG